MTEPTSRPMPAHEADGASRLGPLAETVRERISSAPMGEGIGHGRLRDLLEQELVPQDHVSRKDGRAFGKSLRKQVPRSSHATWEVKEGRERAMGLLRDQERERVQDLLPIRHQRMAESAFAFFRGAAIIMADDLATTPATGISVQASGDAHLANFGIFASPERRLVFDINDFDETLPAPWEWDVKRLMASVEVCGRHLCLGSADRLRALRETADGYHDAMARFSDMGNLEVWYAHLDVEGILREHEDYLSSAERVALESTLKRAERKNSSRAVEKFTEVVDGELRIVSDPPLLVPLRELSGVGISQEAIVRFLGALLARYRLTLPRERRALIDQYEPEDIARKVVGVGSVGMRSWIAVLRGAATDDPLVLQMKEATSSVLEPYAGESAFRDHGKRVVEGQRSIQTASDVLLGWVRVPDENATPRDFYVRQLWDAKGSVNLERLDAKELARFGRLCAWTLAHAHAKTGNRHAIAGYLGKGDAFDDAVCEFAQAYADQNEADYRLFLTTFEDASQKG